VAGLGRFLILAGLVLVVIGALATWGILGRLPGDFRIVRPGFRLYLPLGTSILLSIVLTILLRIFLKK